MYKTTADYVEMLKDKYGLTSNYQLAKFLGKSDAQVAHWAKGRHTFDETTAFVFAEKLKIDPAIIMTCSHIERADKCGKPAAAQVYKRILKTLEKTHYSGAAGFFGVVILAGIMAPILGAV